MLDNETKDRKLGYIVITRKSTLLKYFAWLLCVPLNIMHIADRPRTLPGTLIAFAMAL